MQGVRKKQKSQKPMRHYSFILKRSLPLFLSPSVPHPLCLSARSFRKGVSGSFLKKQILHQLKQASWQQPCAFLTEKSECQEPRLVKDHANVNMLYTYWHKCWICTMFPAARCLPSCWVQVQVAKSDLYDQTVVVFACISTLVAMVTTSKWVHWLGRGKTKQTGHFNKLRSCIPFLKDAVFQRHQKRNLYTRNQGPALILLLILISTTAAPETHTLPEMIS